MSNPFDGYYIAFVQNPRTDRVIESVAPCSSLEDAWVWFKGYWRSEDGFTVSDVQPYQGGSIGNTTPEGA